MERIRCLRELSPTLGLLLFVPACMSMPAPPTVGLQRALYPGLGDLRGDQITEALDQELELSAPVSGGLAWLSESPPEASPGTLPLSEFHRTGVLEAALSALRQDPFSGVATLPTIPQVTDSSPSPHTLEALRSASAKFQYQVALLLQTGTSTDSGLNPLAVGYLALITIPIVPGNDVAVASSAELCAVDVRSGIMLGCSRGRASGRDRFVSPMNLESRRQELAEQTLRESVDTAAKDLRSQVSVRLSHK